LQAPESNTFAVQSYADTAWPGLRCLSIGYTGRAGAFRYSGGQRRWSRWWG